MAEIRGCNIPEDLYYWPEKHVWASLEADGTVKVGLTDVAQSLAGAIVSALPKDPGRNIARGKSLGTAESGKWVGPVSSPVSGEIVETNPALKDPGVLNRAPYGEGWFIRVRPANWEEDRALLVTGASGIAAYQAFLEAEGISCG